MAYNYPNYYGYPAQQMQSQQYQNPQYQIPAFNQSPTQMSGTSQDERIWVQGEGAAQAYLVAPNSFVRLWDSQAPVFYEKRADQSGRPFMDVFEYKRRGSQEPSDAVSKPTQTIDYSEKINALEARIEALEGGRKDAEQ